MIADMVIANLLRIAREDLDGASLHRPLTAGGDRPMLDLEMEAPAVGHRELLRSSL